MKVLIWFGCIVTASLILSVLGIYSLGFIPALIFYGGIAWIARTLCRSWDRHKEKREDERALQLAEERYEREQNEQRIREAEKKQQENATAVSAAAPVSTAVIAPEISASSGPRARLCSSCGFELFDGSGFCSGCGAKVGRDEAS